MLGGTFGSYSTSSLKYFSYMFALYLPNIVILFLHIVIILRLLQFSSVDFIFFLLFGGVFLYVKHKWCKTRRCKVL